VVVERGGRGMIVGEIGWLAGDDEVKHRVVDLPRTIVRVGVQRDDVVARVLVPRLELVREPSNSAACSHVRASTGCPAKGPSVVAAGNLAPEEGIVPLRATRRPRSRRRRTTRATFSRGDALKRAVDDTDGQFPRSPTSATTSGQIASPR